jgi:hypothetical protein
MARPPRTPLSDASGANSNANSNTCSTADPVDMTNGRAKVEVALATVSPGYANTAFARFSPARSFCSLRVERPPGLYCLPGVKSRGGGVSDARNQT